MNIILYNRGIRNYLIYNKILKQNSKLIDIVIEMSALPHSSKSKKISLSKILEMFINCPQFVIMHFLVVSMYSVVTSVFGSDLKKICKKNKIKYLSFKKVDKNLIDFLKSKKPSRIFSSTPHILPKEVIEIPSKGVINFHEAKLPDYKGSASYFWFFVNGEKKANVTCHYVSETIDTGEIIISGKKVSIEKNMTVLNLWRNMLYSYDYVWEYLIPFIKKDIKFPSKKQKKNKFKTYSYPSKEAMKIFKNKKCKFFSMNDIIFIFKICFSGKY